MTQDSVKGKGKFGVIIDHDYPEKQYRYSFIACC